MSKKNPLIARALNTPPQAPEPQSDVPPQEVQDLLGLVIEHPPTLDVIAAWAPEERDAVAMWAGREHLAASDNDDVERLPVPQVLYLWRKATVTITTESSPEPGTPRSDISSAEEEEALRELDAKLNAITGDGVVVEAPRSEMFFVTVDGVGPIDLHNFVYGDDETDALAYYDITPQILYLELNNYTRQLVIVLDRDPRAPMGEDAPTALDLLLRNGYTITRVKRIVSAVREHEVPLYYEAVVALDGDMRVDRPGAARDLYRRDRWYRIKRGPRPFDEKEFYSIAVSTSKPSKGIAVTYGAVLLDTNPHLDTGWIL